MISRNEIQKLADLAHLAVEEKELDTLAREMDAILGYVSDIDTLVAKDADSTQKPMLYNVMREDKVTRSPGEYTERILNNAPRTEKGFIRVKKIL